MRCAPHVGKTSGEEPSRRLVALGKAIASRRATVGMSQRGLAEEIGTGQAAIYEWEVARVSITAERLWDICDALDCEPSDLFATAQTLESELDDD